MRISIIQVGKAAPDNYPAEYEASECCLVLLVAEEDDRPGDSQQGQRCHSCHDTPDTCLASYRF